MEQQGTTRELTFAEATKGSERRGTVRLLKYWERLRDARSMPVEEHFDLSEIDDLMESCFLIQIRDLLEEKQYNYTFIGEKIIAAYESGELRGLIPGLATTDASHLSSEYHGVMAVGEPLITEGKHPLPNGMLKYRQCLLPLSNDSDDKITAILGQMSYKIYPHA